MSFQTARVSRRSILAMLPAAGLGFADQTAASLSDSDQEKFLRDAKLQSSKGASVGITNSRRATLCDGVLTHDAHIQVVDESKTRFESSAGLELNFRDTWKFNIAAYKLDRLLDLRMVPVSVERQFNGQSGCFTWWVDDVLMMEADRVKQRLTAPDQDHWNCQMYVVRVFDQLIYNTDRNLQNLLITKDWKLWMIDHTRAFRTSHNVRDARNLTRCDRKLLAKLRLLTKPALSAAVQPYLQPVEIDGVMFRRDRIIQFLEKHIRESDESAVLYDRA
jgi:hypothetical protein